MTRRVIIEADGGSRGNPGPSGYGAVVRDADTGKLLAGVQERRGTPTHHVRGSRGRYPRPATPSPRQPPPAVPA